MTGTHRWMTAVAALILLCNSPITAHAQISASQVIQRLGYPADSKLLIIHADDFGVAHSVDKATEEALLKGWVTSASIMVPCPWFPEAAKFAREHPDLDLGLHLTLTSEWAPYRWGPISTEPVPSLRDKDGYLPPSEDKAAAQDNPADVAVEIKAQITRAQAAGVRFTHFDTHMETLFQTPQLFQLYQQAAHDYHVATFIAAQNFGNGGKGFSIIPDSVVVTREFQMHPGVPLDKRLATYKQWLTGLAPGLYVLTVHLGYDDQELRTVTAGKPDWWDAPWRESDLKVVSSPDFQQFLKKQGFTLVAWKQVGKAQHSPGTANP
jgi:predicted glycoside hydrolase/deacetylase ChbG (UPF0249 family)